jgi:hypothetical protein
MGNYTDPITFMADPNLGDTPSLYRALGFGIITLLIAPQLYF